MNVKTMGMNIIIFCCMGSALVGVIFCCMTCVTPMMIGRSLIGMVYPMTVNEKRSSGADRSLIHQRNGACLSSIAPDRALYSAKNTGIWGSIGRHPLMGFTPRDL